MNDTILRSQKFEFDLASQLISETDAGGATTAHTFDGLGREIATLLADPDGAGELEAPLWQYSFDVMSNLVLVTDPLLNETAYEFDTLNRRTKIVDAEAGETTFTFDAASNLLSLTDPELNTTTWTFDALNRVVEEENELADSRYFVYDAASNLVQRTDRNGRVLAWQYDGLRRRVAEQWLSSGDPPDGLSVDTTTAGSSVDEMQLVGFGDSLGLAPPGKCLSPLYGCEMFARGRTPGSRHPDPRTR